MAPSNTRSTPSSSFGILCPTYSLTPRSQINRTATPSSAPATNTNGMCIRAYFSKTHTCAQCIAARVGRDADGGMGMELATTKINEAAEGLREVAEKIGDAVRRLEELGKSAKEYRERRVRARARKGRVDEGKTGAKEVGRGVRQKKTKHKDKEQRERKKKTRAKGHGGGEKKRKRKPIGQGSDSEEWEWETDDGDKPALNDDWVRYMDSWKRRTKKDKKSLKKRAGKEVHGHKTKRTKV